MTPAVRPQRPPADSDRLDEIERRIDRLEQAVDEIDRDRRPYGDGSGGPFDQDYRRWPGKRSPR